MCNVHKYLALFRRVRCSSTLDHWLETVLCISWCPVLVTTSGYEVTVFRCPVRVQNLFKITIVREKLCSCLALCCNELRWQKFCNCSNKRVCINLGNELSCINLNNELSWQKYHIHSSKCPRCSDKSYWMEAYVFHYCCNDRPKSGWFGLFSG